MGLIKEKKILSQNQTKNYSLESFFHKKYHPLEIHFERKLEKNKIFIHFRNGVLTRCLKRYLRIFPKLFVNITKPIVEKYLPYENIQLVSSMGPSFVRKRIILQKQTIRWRTQIRVASEHEQNILFYQYFSYSSVRKKRNQVMDVMRFRFENVTMQLQCDVPDRFLFRHFPFARVASAFHF